MRANTRRKHHTICTFHDAAAAGLAPAARMGLSERFSIMFNSLIYTVHGISCIFALNFHKIYSAVFLTRLR
jgi:hypothetical protein